MKAIVCERYGPPEVLHLTEVATPTPQDDEVLIRVHATTVNSGDARLRAFRVPLGFGLVGRLAFGLFKPRNPVFGFELSGEVEAVGAAVRKFKPGDQVFATGGGGLGCHVEYKVVAENGPIALKPSNLSHEEAATLCFGGTTALYFFRQGRLQAGESVLVNGASGAVGVAAVQLAKHFGADVTGVCSAANRELVLALGADRVIDYTTEDFTANGVTYDIIIDCAGTAPWGRAKGSLKPGGRLLQVMGGLPDMLHAPFVAMTSSHKVVSGQTPDCPEDVKLLGELATSGAYRPVVDRTYPFEQIAEAHRYVDTGRKRGSVVITIGQATVASTPAS